MHSFVIGEIACGSLADRSTLLPLLKNLPAAVVADDEEVLSFIERHGLYGQGMGFVDLHLLASVALTARATLWTRDKRLRAAAADLHCVYQEPDAC